MGYGYTVDPIVKPNKYPMWIGLMGPIGVLGEKAWVRRPRPSSRPNP